MGETRMTLKLRPDTFNRLRRIGFEVQLTFDKDLSKSALVDVLCDLFYLTKEQNPRLMEQLYINEKKKQSD